MAGELTDLGETLLLDLINGVTTAAPVTTPLKLALMTAQGTDSAAGTEVTGGSYARQTITFGATTSGTGNALNTNSITFTNMPACTVVGAVIYDSSGTPKRLWELPAGTSRTYALGDTATVAVGAVSLTLS